MEYYLENFDSLEYDVNQQIEQNYIELEEFITIQQPTELELERNKQKKPSESAQPRNLTQSIERTNIISEPQISELNLQKKTSQPQQQKPFVQQNVISKFQPQIQYVKTSFQEDNQYQQQKQKQQQQQLNNQYQQKPQSSNQDSLQSSPFQKQNMSNSKQANQETKQEFTEQNFLNRQEVQPFNLNFQFNPQFKQVESENEEIYQAQYNFQQMLETSMKNFSTQFSRNKTYLARQSYPVPECYPHIPQESVDFEKLNTDTLFFIFYHQQGSYSQYQAAQQLKQMKWRYHKKYMTWFLRYDEPKVSNNQMEQGSFAFFDHENGWMQRLKPDFTFEYCYLENELPQKKNTQIS